VRDIPETPGKIPWKGGDEFDVLDPYVRRAYTFTKKAGVCARVKRRYRRRMRHMTRVTLSGITTTVVEDI